MGHCRSVINIKALMLMVFGLITVMHTVVAAPKATKEELNVVSQRLERLERALDKESSDSANKSGLITLQKKLNRMESELQELRGQNESLRNQLETMQKHQRKSLMAIDKRLQMQYEQGSTDVASPENSERTLKKKQDQDSEGVRAEIIEPEPAERKPIVVSSETQDSDETIAAYRDAFLLLKGRRYNESIDAFESFLENYPNSKYAANAQYWLAEANYVTKRYERALKDFQTVVERYPASSKLPDARLKIGFTQYELEQFKQARVTLTRLRTQFPNSTVAGLAQERLARMDKEGH